MVEIPLHILSGMSCHMKRSSPASRNTSGAGDGEARGRGGEQAGIRGRPCRRARLVSVRGIWISGPDK